MKKVIALGIAGVFMMAACTTTEKVAVQQTKDAKLDCAGLEAEFAKLDAIMEDAEGDKGVNTANVASVLLFWPAAVGNYMNAKDAQELVEKRRTHLMGFYTEKGC